MVGAGCRSPESRAGNQPGNKTLLLIHDEFSIKNLTLLHFAVIFIKFINSTTLNQEKIMKKSLIMGALLVVAAASYAADKVYDISTAANWYGKDVKAGQDAGTIVVSKPAIIQAKVMIPIDDKHTYTFSGSAIAPAGKVGGTTLTGYYLFDKNKKPISQTNVVFVAKSETELAEPAKNGDKTIKIKANAKWKPAGHIWAAFNYDKNRVCRDLSATSVRAVKKEGDIMIITFAAGIRKDYPAGTKVRIHNSGSYFYSSVFPVKATAGKFTKTLKQKDFWPGTAYATPIVLVNWLIKPGTDKNTFETVYKNLKVTVKEIK
jgi:hypothetical protein